MDNIYYSRNVKGIKGKASGDTHTQAVLQTYSLPGRVFGKTRLGETALQNRLEETGRNLYLARISFLIPSDFPARR